jgi:hypothetical protein
MIELILIVVFLGVGLLYATLASHPMSFDDLFELRFLPSRRREPPLTYDGLGLSSDDHAGICAHRGQVNSPFTNHVCNCTGWKYKQMFFGVPLCECGDEIQVHGRKR